MGLARIPGSLLMKRRHRDAFLAKASLTGPLTRIIGVPTEISGFKAEEKP